MKILVYDSGLGGLTVAAPVLKKYPTADMIYFGDLANLPYGSKSSEHIKRLVSENLSILFKNNPKITREVDLAIMACNTASAHALEQARHVLAPYNIPIVGVLEPACKLALQQFKKRIVVLATQSTVASGAYSRTLLDLGHKCSISLSASQIIEKACPLFVPIVEEGLAESEIAEWTAKHYLDQLLETGDTVILGCTHYPFLTKTLAKLYPHITWVEAGSALLREEIVKTSLDIKAMGASLAQIIFTDETCDEKRLSQIFKQLGIESRLNLCRGGVLL